jgi:hypothetical protein
MNVKDVVMDKVYNIDGTLYLSDIDHIINDANNFVYEYLNVTLGKVFEKKLMGIASTKDIVGDIRRAMLFFIFIKKEMLNDLSNDVDNEINYYKEKYETELYRDYLVCRCVDSEIIDGLFNIFDFNYIYQKENINGESKDRGIEEMQIEGTEFPFQIY